MKQYNYLKSILNTMFIIGIFTLMNACSSGNSGSGQTPTSEGTAGLTSVGKIYGTSLPNSNAISKANITIQNLIGTVYHIPIYNTSESSNLTIIRQEINHNNVWSVSPIIASDCVNIKPNDKCFIDIAFNGAAVTLNEELNAVLTITYKNNSTSLIPLSANIVSANSGVQVDLPSVIIPNANGFATGVITVFNSSTTESQLITESTIVANNEPGVTWTFSPNCDNGSSIVAPLSACSIVYTYNVAQGTTPSAPIVVTVPVTNLTTNQVAIYNLPATQAPVPNPTNPAPYLAYLSGATVFVPTSGSTAILLTNTGTATLPSVSAVSNVNDAVTVNTANCNNLAPDTSCMVYISRNNVFNTGSITFTPSTGLPNSITVNIVGQTLIVNPITIDFGTNNADSHVTRTVTVSNAGQLSLDNLTIDLLDSNSPFLIESSTCSATLAGLSSCTVSILYTAPNIDGSQSNTLSVSTSTIGNEAYSIPLSATSVFVPLTMVTMTTPNVLRHVGVGTPIIIEFSRAIDPSTVNANSFKLGTVINDANVVAQSISISNDNKSATFVFTPNIALDLDRVYYVTVESSILDVNGKHIAKFNESFMTQKESYYIFPIGLKPFVNPSGYPGSYTGSAVGGITGADNLCQTNPQCESFGVGSVCKAMMVSSSGVIRTAAPVPQNWVLAPYTAYKNTGEDSPIGITGITPVGFTQPATNSQVFAFMLAESGNSPYIPPFWTGYNADWTTGNTCSSWTSNTDTGSVVRIHLSYTLTWTYQQSNCSNENAIMCVQQPPND